MCVTIEREIGKISALPRISAISCKLQVQCRAYRINFLRLNILKVFQISEKHITKITSVDEFLRRIYSVIHSNDPVARAVTLRYMYMYIHLL